MKITFEEVLVKYCIETKMDCEIKNNMNTCKKSDLKGVYSFFEDSIVSFPEKYNGSISLCKFVVNTKLLVEVYLTRLLSAITNSPMLVAKKLVNDIIEECVDIQKCDYIFQKGKEVESAFRLFLNNSLRKSELIVHQLLDEKFGYLIKHIFTKSPQKEVAKITLALKSLIKDLSDEPLKFLRLLLFQKVTDLVQFYDDTEKLYFYFIDEYTGKVVQTSAFTLDSNNKLDIFMNLLPSLYLSMGSFCTKDISSGILKMIGRDKHFERNHWNLISGYRLDLDSLPLDTHIDSLCTVIGEMTESDEYSSHSSILFDNFSYLKSFIESVNTDHNYSGMKRLIYSKSGDVLWALPDSEEIILSHKTH